MRPGYLVPQFRYLATILPCHASGTQLQSVIHICPQAKTAVKRICCTMKNKHYFEKNYPKRDENDSS